MSAIIGEQGAYNFFDFAFTRLMDTDKAVGRWLIAIDCGAVIELRREHFCFAPG
jgi:hypothetical protein